MYLKGNDEDGTGLNEQWGIAGDTFVVGCKIPNECVYPDFNNLNQDMNNYRYNQKYGIYQPNCGLDRCYISWGHDEYLYRVLKHNKDKYLCKDIDGLLPFVFGKPLSKIPGNTIENLNIICPADDEIHPVAYCENSVSLRAKYGDDLEAFARGVKNV